MIHSLERMKMVRDALREEGGTKIGIVKLGRAAGKVRGLFLYIVCTKSSE